MVYVNHKHNLIIYSRIITRDIVYRQTPAIPSVRSHCDPVSVSSLQSRPRAAPAPRVDATAKGRQRPKTLTASRGTWGLPVGAALSLTNVHCERRHLDDERRTSSTLIY